MTGTQNRQNSLSLVFSSSDASPLAYIGGRAVSLERFKTDVLTLVDHLAQNKVRKTLITSKRRYAFSVALLASWLVKATVILPPDQHKTSLERIRRVQQPGFECDSVWCEQLLARQSSSGEAHGRWSVDLPSDLIATLLYTSGSTGKPKMIEKTLANLLTEANCLGESFDWPDAAIVGTVPAQHLYGLSFSVLLPWVLGVPWVDEVPLFPQDILSVVEQSHAGTLICVPPHYNALIQHNMSAFDLLCVSAAAPLMPQTASQWAGLYHQQIVEIYGSTETGIVAHRLQLKDRHWQAFSPVKLGVASGLLRVCSPFVSGQSEQHFQTADQVRLKSNHRFELLGRADAVIKIGGKRVSLRAVEDALVQCDGVRDAAVLAVSVQSVVREQAIWAVLEAPNTGACSAISLRKALRDKLDGVSIPKRFVWVDKLPRNSNGKIIRQSLAALFEPRAAIDV